MRAWIKGKGEAKRNFVLPLLFTVGGHVRSPHTLAVFFVVLLQGSSAGQPEWLFCIMPYSKATTQGSEDIKTRILLEQMAYIYQCVVLSNTHYVNIASGCSGQGGQSWPNNKRRRAEQLPAEGPESGRQLRGDKWNCSRKLVNLHLGELTTDLSTGRETKSRGIKIRKT